MIINLVRVESTDHGVFGHLDCEGFSCVTLENHLLNIPVGLYKITLYQSPVHGLVPLLHDVSGRSMIEIHEGNFENNSKGCILVAEKRDGFAIENSRKTLPLLVEKIKGADDVALRIS